MLMTTPDARTAKRAAAQALDDTRWSAVLARDAASDAAFVYAVATTNIYCRPTCPSRHPLRKNVRFFDRADDAERAGFTACKRCRPSQATSALATECAVVASACASLLHEDPAPSVAELAKRAGHDVSWLRRVFARHLGVSPQAWRQAHRRASLQQELSLEGNVSASIARAGIPSAARVYEASATWLGMTPGNFARGGAGRRVGLASARCELGWLAIAATEKGIAALAIADTRIDAEQPLRERLFAAEFIAADPALNALLDRAIASVREPALAQALPIDVRGTAFQCRVWSALMAIPAGTTTTYSALAAAMGQPTATRAVAKACADNPVALAIPCHRVVGVTGALTGYRWGVPRKRALLEKERRAR